MESERGRWRPWSADREERWGSVGSWPALAAVGSGAAGAAAAALKRIALGAEEEVDAPPMEALLAARWSSGEGGFRMPGRASRGSSGPGERAEARRLREEAPVVW
jgi:hypothetical protein